MNSKTLKIVLTLLAIGIFSMATIRISKAGINKIKVHEALKLYPYQDVAGIWTIGYGHVIKPDEQHLKIGAPITEDYAEELLKEDIAVAEKAVNDLVKAPLTGNQYDALVSFVYNVGINAFEHSTMLSKINQGDYEGAAEEFPRWKYSGGKEVAGLLARRAREQNLFLT